MWQLLSTTTIRFWAFVGIASTIIGFGGVPDDLATWTRWIDSMVNDPTVLWLATYAVEIADFINQAWVRIALVVVGVLLVIWPLRWFWRLRHRWLFKWRRFVSEQVWISRDDALTLIRESAWGRLKSPTITRRVRTPSSLYSGILSGLGGREYDERVSGLSDTEKALIKFSAYLAHTLDQFVEDNPSGCKKEKGGNELIDETKLRAFLKKAMEHEVRDEFGDVPSFKV